MRSMLPYPAIAAQHLRVSIWDPPLGLGLRPHLPPWHMPIHPLSSGSRNQRRGLGEGLTLPPSRSRPSSTIGWCPASARYFAVERPARPPPAITTRSGRSGRGAAAIAAESDTNNQAMQFKYHQRRTGAHSLAGTARASSQAVPSATAAISKAAVPAGS